jgi:hypothetical protein
MTDAVPPIPLRLVSDDGSGQSFLEIGPREIGERSVTPRSEQEVVPCVPAGSPASLREARADDRVRRAADRRQDERGPRGQSPGDRCAPEPRHLGAAPRRSTASATPIAQHELRGLDRGPLDRVALARTGVRLARVLKPDSRRKANPSAASTGPIFPSSDTCDVLRKSTGRRSPSRRCWQQDELASPAPALGPRSALRWIQNVQFITTDGSQIARAVLPSIFKGTS